MPKTNSTLAFLVTALLAAPAVATLHAVPTGGQTSGPCSAWANACTLQTALAAASSGDEIWVQGGLYKPGASPLDTFSIPPGVAVYGGFSGTETARDQRDPAAYVTILSGDIDADDANGDGNHIDESAEGIAGTNSLHVVTIDGEHGAKATATTVLDGFTITAGDAAGTNLDAKGGGLLCLGSNSGNECSPTLANLIFSGNRAEENGGAMYDFGNAGASSPAVTLTTFVGNSAQVGGAVYNNGFSGGVSSPTLSHVTFANNGGIAIFNGGVGGTSDPSLTDVTFTSNGNGAMFNSSANPTLTHVTFSGNSSSQGGAIYDSAHAGESASPILTDVTFKDNSAGTGGAIFNDASSAGTASPVLTNVTFSGNSASGNGGAIYNYTNGGTASPVLTNVTFNGNSARVGGGIYNWGTGGVNNPTLKNVILWGDSAQFPGHEIYNRDAAPMIDSSIVEGGDAGSDNNTGPDTAFSSGSGNLATDPHLGPLANNGGSIETLALGAGSSAIDSGDDGVCPATDERGAPRAHSPHCDIGAFEAGITPPGSCVAEANLLCIDGAPGDHRYRVQVSYHTTLGSLDGLLHPGHAIPLSPVSVTDGGLFWFFGKQNPEMLIKIIDGRKVNGHRWVFYSAGTSVGLDTTVEDTETGTTILYSDADHHPAPPVLDVAAFTANGQPGTPYHQVDHTFDYAHDLSVGPGVAPSCATTPTSVCIGGRFLVSVSYHTTQGGGDGLPHAAHAIALSSLGVDRGGLFWFFDGRNPEMLIKVLNACPSTNHYWVFFSAGTSVGLETTVEDTVAHMVNTYTNDDRTQAPPLLDTQAFPCP